MDSSYRPWGKIIGIVVIGAVIMAAFVWKYLTTLDGSQNGHIVHVPKVIMPIYERFGAQMFLVIGAAASLLFVVGGLYVLLKKD